MVEPEYGTDRATYHVSAQLRVRIENLAEHTDLIPTVALWIYDEWTDSFLSRTFEELVASLQERTTPHTIPETFVAVEDTVVVGTASLVIHDMTTRKDLSPWLAAVYVLPGFRNRGVGSALVRAVMQEAKMLGLRRLYLFTPEKMDFYSRLGWQALERTEYCGKLVTIMEYEITPCEGQRT